MRTSWLKKFSVYAMAGLTACLVSFCIPSLAAAQSAETLTPTQREIQKQQERLGSSSDEDRRDAVMRLGAMHLSEASRVAVRALTDASPMVRAVAAKAVLSLPVAESVQVLLPLLQDRDEFARREACYALGMTRSRNATAAITERLTTDKEDGVRAAAAVALGDIADETSVVTLSTILTGQSKRKGKQERNEFVLRASAAALGQIRSAAGVPALVGALRNEKFSDDVRREAAAALGWIGDPTAVSALNDAVNSADPYLSRIAYESLKKISR
ncbi:MAG TPA: HEAT repeat domain-containing protein [Pyrinomonadaceae bacterium]|nr:HEAT repeat domain-containing protein [Pyrinomonadaceae bacterium]